MLELTKINEVVNKAASATLKKPASVRRVMSEPTVDFDGDEALQITIVLNNGVAEEITGDEALDTLVNVSKALQAASEDRFPYISYVTEEELASSGDAES
jgi:hypothetical protein